MDSITLTPKGALKGSVNVPGSKSITNRALLLAALAEGQSVLVNALESEDTLIMLDALKQLGVPVLFTDAKININGCNGRFPVTQAELYVANSGTSARFLTAALALCGGKYRIYGQPRMHERPIGDLLKALAQFGASIRCENGNECPPLLISDFEKRVYPSCYKIQEGENGKPATTGANEAGGAAVHTDFGISVSGKISSQFLSALLMAAPLVAETQRILINVTDGLVSEPYIRITTDVMRSFGVSVETDWNSFGNSFGNSFIVPQGSRYSGTHYSIEPDASAASYFFAAAAVTGGQITVLGLDNNSLQGDIRFVECLRKMGCNVEYSQNKTTVSRNPETPLRGISVDMNDISDTVQTLSVVALFADSPTHITNIAHIRHKETDRISALAAELRKFGAFVEERTDGLSITPPKSLQGGIAIETYNDHRMAMSFAIAGLRVPNVAILDPKCTQKTFPLFFDTLGSL